MYLKLFGSLVAVCLIIAEFGAPHVAARNNSPERKLKMRSNVQFDKATISGPEFIRPYTGKKLSAHEKYFSTYPSNCSSEQIHLTLGNDYNSVSFVSYGNYTTPSTVSYYSIDNEVLSSIGTASSYSQLLYVKSTAVDPSMGPPVTTDNIILSRENTIRWAYDQLTGEHWSNWFNITVVKVNTGMPYNNPYGIYNSPLVHTVTLSGLVPGVTYFYQVAGSCEEFSFQIPLQYPVSDAYPMTVGLTGDLGQTEVSARTVSALVAMDPAVVLLVGDLSYADGWAFLWDSFGSMIQSLAANVPLLTTGGNHEIDYSENWLSYSARYPSCYRATGSTNPCYWAREVGVMNVIAVCSYAQFTNGSLQHRWLVQYLETSIDRTRTPWVTVLMHVPFYNSNADHWMEGELMRRALEPLFYQYGVDIVVAGHVHSYERIHPVFDSHLNECGPVYLNVGDGGNYEGWQDSSNWQNSSNATYSSNSYIWSAFREDSFGAGQLTILNASAAVFVWYKHACGSSSFSAYYMNFSANCSTPTDNSPMRLLSSDETTILRPSSAVCPNRHVSTSSTTVPSQSPDSGEKPKKNYTIIIIVSVLVPLFVITFVCAASNVLYPRRGQTSTTLLTSKAANPLPSISTPAIDIELNAPSQQI